MAMTVVSNVTWDQDAWEKFAYFALRPELYFDPVADVRGEHLTAEGSPTVKFVITADLNAATTALDESTDVTPAALSDSTVTVTLREYGNAVTTSALVRGTSFLPVDPVVANIVGYNAGVSIDTLVRDVLKAGSNVRYAKGAAAAARNRVIPTDTLGAADVRYVVAKLRAANVAAEQQRLLHGVRPPGHRRRPHVRDRFGLMA
jgi:N4-gp56 family major capsid protein